MRWPSYPPTPLFKKGIRCHHFGQHHDIHVIYSTTLHQCILTRTLVHYNGEKLVHQSIFHKLQPNNYHKESLITSRCLIFPSFYFPTNQFGILNYKTNQMNQNIILSLRTLQSGTRQLNHAYLAWKLAVKPTSCKFYSFSTTHRSAATEGSTKTLYRRFTKLHHASQLKSAFPIFT
jgi:hypothetical protein